MRRPGSRRKIPFSRIIPWKWMALLGLFILWQAATLGLDLARAALEWVGFWAAWLLLLYAIGRWWRAGWLAYYLVVRRLRRWRAHGSAR